MTQIQAEAVAKMLWDARQSGVPCAPPSETFSGLSLEAAYLASKINFARRVQATGVEAIGKKIGLTSRAVQQQLGVEQPDFGYLSSDMLVPNRGILPKGSLIQGRVEGEVAFILGKRLLGTNLQPEAVVAATECVYASIEIIDSRVRDWRIRIQDTIADNASSAFFVLGDSPKRLDAVDLVKARMELRVNGELRSTGVGSACLDNPLLAVTWLANTLGAYDVALEPGDIILSGAYGPVVPIKPGDHTQVEIEGLGHVEFVYGSEEG